MAPTKPPTDGKKRTDNTLKVIDEWETVEESPSYNQDEFYCRGGDRKGHSAVKYLRMPPELVAVCEEIHQSKMFPYRTDSDIIRDAIVHRVAYLRTRMQSGKVDQEFVTIMSIQNILKEEELESEHRSAMARMESVMQEMQLDPDEGIAEAKKLLAKMFETISAMPNNFRRRQYERTMKQKYSHLLEQK